MSKTNVDPARDLKLNTVMTPTQEPQSPVCTKVASNWTWDPTRGNNFDFLRLAMALLVLFSHCYVLVYGTNHGFEPLARLLDDRSCFGTLAVDVFFAISGFLITMSWERSSSWFSYLLKRIARIVPGYLFVTLIGVFIIAPLFTADAKVWSWNFIAGHLWPSVHRLGETPVPGVFAHNPLPGTICGTVWTLTVEFACYLGILVLGLTRTLPHRWITLGFFAFYLAWGIIPHQPSLHRPFNPSCAPLICYFFGGMVFYLYRKRIPQRPWLAIVALIFVLTPLAAPPLLNFAWPLFGTYLVFWVAFQPYLTVHHFAKYGDFSYGVYLYGFPIQQILISQFPALRGPAILFVCAAPLSVLAGCLSWHIVEKRFLRKSSLRLKQGDGQLLVNPPVQPVSRVNILGVGVSAINMDSAVKAITDRLRRRQKGYICVTGVHGVSEAQSDQGFRQILNRAFLCTPDGMPLVWVGRLKGHRQMDRVYGPDLMLAVMEASEKEGWRHFFYGGANQTAECLRQCLLQRFPKLLITGVFEPPFRPLDSSERADLQRQVAAARPDIFWVGLSTPKQEKFMAEFLSELDITLMIGVGAAFDFHAGRVKQAPRWMQRSGLEWLFRLCCEPRRLWKRYLKNNPLFVVRLFCQWSGVRDFPLHDDSP